MKRHRAILSFILLLAALPLFAGTARAQPGCAPPVPDGLRLAVERRQDNALIFDATIELASPAPVYVEWGNDAVGWLRSATSPAATSHQLPIMRLRPESAYQLRAVALGADGCPAATASTSVTSGRLPSLLRQMEIQSSGRAGMPLVMFDYRRADTDIRYFVALDQDGQVVWYRVLPRSNDTGHTGLALIRRANGNLLYLSRALKGVEELTPDGRVVRQIALTSFGGSRIHHDLTELPDGRILFLGVERRQIDDTANGGSATRDVIGDTLNVLDLDSGLDQQVWSAFDALDPTQRLPQWKGLQFEDAVDWTHTNTVSLGPHGNVILSSRHLNQVISLSPDLQTIEWRLGGLDSSFSFPNPDDQFYGQHDATELPNGHILMYDNGNYRPGGQYSRGLELELDFGSMTAHKVWEFRHEPDVFSNVVGSASRLPSGNTLVNFGFVVNADDPLPLVEVRPDGTVAWELLEGLDGVRAIRYRAYPLTALAGEQAI